MSNDEPLQLGEDTTEPAESWGERYRAVRRASERLCEPLEPEDATIQSMPDASPTRWHLAHTTWFFETFVLSEALDDYRPYDARYDQLFNSYYNAIGDPFPRARRGTMSRPTLREILAYRHAVDEQVEEWLGGESGARDPALVGRVELGLQHEQQHQELILTDVKHALGSNPLLPAYREADDAWRRARGGSAARGAGSHQWWMYASGLHEFGHPGGGFAFDNELPRHQAYLGVYELAPALVTNREYLQFIGDGGYQRPELWLSLGWDAVTRHGWEAPLYWVRRDDGWSHYTLRGLCDVTLDEPVCHVSYFEADAFARWAGARLPTEYEWELAAEDSPLTGNLLESERLHPGGLEALSSDGPSQMFGDVWEWTSSAYAGYPGFRPLAGAVGEYNGKFMCNQFVLRGGSCVTPRSHMRATYRNFFPPEARWQFTGIRLAR